MNRVTKVILTSLILLCVAPSFGQNLIDRFKLGVFGGINRSIVSSTEAHAIVEGGMLSNEKSYAPFMENKGYQIGLLFRVDILPVLVFSYEPNFQSVSFLYSNEYAWAGQENYAQKIGFQHRLRSIEHPFYLEFRKTFGIVQPYVKAGGYFSTLVGANSALDITSTNSSLPGNTDSKQTDNISSNSNFTTGQNGLSAGTGIRITLGQVALGIDLTYRMPLSDFTNTNTQYANAQLSGGYYDTMDAINMHNFALSLQLLAPFGKGGGGAHTGGRLRGAVPCPTEF